ncbi:alpha-mannosidase [Cohnella nanjingensis]|uniref:Glycoside hydrolase family 38 central domain-containing protein n=1 Tax=Cohnella nanjingensis TaxID=1387779 RepID=A0A7X0RLQ6_9BACL|nr:glycoside hydrolase family 38 C-terminal domain-containing protein [Cohnella nanjingensis]MBB6669782.1 hypothetical protein [Cohnella nanjingensis]
MRELKEIHLVSHTHWDREWYLPYEVFRFRLVGLLDRLLRTLEEHPPYRFHLDGQAIILEDYLEIRPENRTKIEKFVQNGQLVIGPWYVLIDEYLVSPESIIRNLEEGGRIASAFGPVLQVGYLPDTFGHIAQMPQILKQYGMNYGVIWRGHNGRPDQAPTEFEWEAPNGDCLTTIHLPYKHGYTSAMDLSEDPEEASVRLRELVADIGTHTQTGYVLLMNGFDHMEPQTHIPVLIDYWNEHEQVPIKHSGIVDYIVASLADNPPLMRLHGEFRHTNHSPGAAINTILPNVLSSRVYLKQQNAAAQNLMERWVEPLEALSLLVRDEHHPQFVRQAWKYILQNHPHDSICGCSIDEVHQEMETRFKKADQIGEQLVVQSLLQLSEGIDRSWVPEGSVPVLLFNSLPWRRDAIAEIELDADDETVYRSVRIQDRDGMQYKGEIVSIDKICPIEKYAGKYPLGKAETNRHKAWVHIKNMPALGYKLVAAKLSKVPILDNLPIASASAMIENEYLRIAVEADGTVTWTDLKTGREWRGLHRFEDSGDVGDEYSYSQPILNERFVTSSVASVSVKGEGYGYKRMTIEYELSIPKSADPRSKRRSEDRITLSITTELTLPDSGRTASFRTIVDNRARDHRLRLLFPLPIGDRPVVAGGHYDVSARPVRVAQPPEAVWIENEPTTFPFRHFLFADHDHDRVILNAKGLHEYEWIPAPSADGGTLAITLFRSVSQLGGADRGMTTMIRPGPGVAAEEGQCIRKMTFEYGVTIGRSENLPAPWRVADEQEIAVKSRVLDKYKSASAAPVDSSEYGWLELDTDAIHMTSVRPIPDQGNGIELRLVNLHHTAVEANLLIGLPILAARLAGLNGELKQAVDLQDRGDQGRRLVVSVRPKEIMTIQLFR